MKSRLGFSLSLILVIGCILGNTTSEVLAEPRKESPIPEGFIGISDNKITNMNQLPMNLIEDVEVEKYEESSSKIETEDNDFKGTISKKIMKLVSKTMKVTK